MKTSVSASRFTAATALIAVASASILAIPTGAGASAQDPSAPPIATAPDALSGAGSPQVGRRGPWAPSAYGKLLTHHAIISDDAPARQLNSVNVRLDVNTGRLNADVRLKAAPTAETQSLIGISFGTWNSDFSLCTTITGVSFNAEGSSVPGLTRDGAHIVLANFLTTAGKGARPNCAFAGTYVDNTFETEYDAVLDTVTPVALNKPALRIGAKTIKVKPGRWQKAKIKVINRSAYAAAPAAKLAWSGRGVQVKGNHNLKSIPAGKSKTVTLRVRLNGRKTQTLRLKASSYDVRTTKRVMVRPGR